MAQTDPALHVIPDPILEALRIFYRRGLAILAQTQMERQAAEFGETLEGDPHPAASDAPVKGPDTRFGELGTATLAQIAETLGQDKSNTRASGW